MLEEIAPRLHVYNMYPDIVQCSKTLFQDSNVSFAYVRITDLRLGKAAVDIFLETYTCDFRFFFALGSVSTGFTLECTTLVFPHNFSCEQ